MQVQFLEERIIDLETLVDKLRNNGTHQWLKWYLYYQCLLLRVMIDV
jgi:hypothetical protein